MSEWLLCELCHFSWLRDPSRLVPLRCPECRASGEPTVVRFGEAE